jgi:hypothetical protein
MYIGQGNEVSITLRAGRLAELFFCQGSERKCSCTTISSISSLKLRLGPGNAVVQPHFWFDTWPWGGNAVAQLHFYAQP